MGIFKKLMSGNTTGILDDAIKAGYKKAKKAVSDSQKKSKSRKSSDEYISEYSSSSVQVNTSEPVKKRSGIPWFLKYTIFLPLTIIWWLLKPFLGPIIGSIIDSTNE